MPELEITYPICAKGCRKIRDAEFLEDIRYIHFSQIVHMVCTLVLFIIVL